MNVGSTTNVFVGEMTPCRYPHPPTSPPPSASPFLIQIQHQSLQLYSMQDPGSAFQLQFILASFNVCVCVCATQMFSSLLQPHLHEKQNNFFITA